MGCPFCEERPGCAAPICGKCRARLSYWRNEYAQQGTEFTPTEIEAIFRGAYWGRAFGGYTHSEAMAMAITAVMGADWKTPEWMKGVGVPECPN